ncbi:MAG: histidinol-phosphate transaminase [Acidimicrobiales bacterium]
MTVRIRPHLLELPSYRPGRRPDQVAARNAVKLSSNESPFAPLPGVAESIAAAAAGANRYPDSNQGPLRDLIAGDLGVAADQVVVAGGTLAMFGPLLQCVVSEGDEVVFAWRTFEAPVTATAVLGGRPVLVPLRDWRHDLDAMAGAMTGRTRAVVVCNPNNPTGTVVKPEDLKRFLGKVPSETLVVLDEAYRDFVTDPDFPDGVDLLRAGHTNIAVLRTFSKAHGLAGIRIGHCITSQRLAAVLTRLVPVFSVSRLAEAAGIASMSPKATREKELRLRLTVHERERIRSRLGELGLDVPPSEGNFVWLPVGEQAAELAEKLESDGVIVRAYPPDGVRVTVGLPEENEAFLAAVAPLIAG